MRKSSVVDMNILYGGGEVDTPNKNKDCLTCQVETEISNFLNRAVRLLEAHYL